MFVSHLLLCSLPVFLLCLSLILFIVGMSAWSADEDTVTLTHWTYSESAYDNDLVTMYGLQSIVAGDLSNDDFSRVAYEDCDENDFCDHCRSAGQTALATCLLAFFCLCPLVVTTGLRIMKVLDNKMIKLGSIFLVLSVLFWSVIAVWNWQGSCVDLLPIEARTSGYKNGPGYNCIVCNIVWMLLSLYLHVCTTANVPSDGSKSEPLTNQEEDSTDDDVYVQAPDGNEKNNQV